MSTENTPPKMAPAQYQIKHIPTPHYYSRAYIPELRPCISLLLSTSENYIKVNMMWVLIKRLLTENDHFRRF